MKKTLLKVVSYVLVAAIAIGGTVAFLQDTDSDVNVMTLGNVHIEQMEYQRVVDENGNWVSTGAKDKYGYEPDKIEEFVDNKPLYPAYFSDGVIKWDDRNGSGNPSGAGSHQQSWAQIGAPGSNQLFDASVKNVQDKFVFVKNTGKSEAYVRTFVALEQGAIAADQFKNVIMTNTNANHWDWEVVDTGVEIEDSVYYVLSATYKGPSSNPDGVLAPGAITYASLLQVYMTPEATNEECEAIDGNKNGKYDILVLSQACQTNGFANAATALDTSFGVAAEINAATNEQNVVGWFEGAENLADTWDGTADTAWYDEDKTEFKLTTAEEIAGLSQLVDNGVTFEGKTVMLNANVDLYAEDENGNYIRFNPIGSYRNDQEFKGTFDGQGHSIFNMSQDTWALNTGYYYGDLGLGFFSAVRDATIKDLVIDGARISGESALCGAVAATAYGECVFENIIVRNTEVNDYQYYAGGVVGWASGSHVYRGISIEESTVVGSQWGDFGNCNGGVIGGVGTSGKYHFENCTVACRIDATNDVVSAYQWYNYRNSGMLIGKVGPKTIVNEVTTVPMEPTVTCENVIVTYGDWANYHYCEFAGTGYPYVRVEAGVSVDVYSNVRYGHPTDANGNVVTDDNHVHNDGEAHHELIAFDYLFGGPANHRYCYYGISSYDGVTVIYNNK